MFKYLALGSALALAGAAQADEPAVEVAPGVTIKMPKVPGVSGSVIVNSGNGVGNSIRVGSGPGVTVVANTRNGIGNTLTVPAGQVVIDLSSVPGFKMPAIGAVPKETLYLNLKTGQWQREPAARTLYVPLLIERE